MRICNLSSGSDGNLTYIETKQAKVLLDAGLSCLEITKRLSLLGVGPEEIDAILITHEHADHIKGLDVFASKFNTKVYVHHKGYTALVHKLKKEKEIQFVLFDDLDFYIKDLLVTNFALPHDAVYCSGYTFKGWNEGNNKFNPGDKVIVDRNIVFVAEWSRNVIGGGDITTRYTLTYETNGGNKIAKET